MCVRVCVCECVCVCVCVCECECVFVDIMYSVNVHENTQQLCTKYISIVYKLLHC